MEKPETSGPLFTESNSSLTFLRVYRMGNLRVLHVWDWLARALAAAPGVLAGDLATVLAEPVAGVVDVLPDHRARGGDQGVRVATNVRRGEARDVGAALNRVEQLGDVLARVPHGGLSEEE